ncbi:MAG: energy transducer TonB [Flavobacteriaceae bacterium]|nr:energy transducer TonB [Flavobacteriaceae bacterium]
MRVLETKHQRKSFVITTAILLLLLFLIFNFGMTYLDPPEEYGLAINFGDATIGNGEPITKTKKIQATKVAQKEEVVEEVTKVKPEEVVPEKIITNETTKEVPVVEKKEQPKEVKKAIVEEKKPIKKEEPKPSKEAKDALQNLLKGNSNDGKPKGEGDDTKEGVKGDKKGDENSNKYYGNIGSGSDGNYNLGDRKVLNPFKPKSDCQVEGKVVIAIFVDRKGRVVSATPGARGSTVSDPCLEEIAKKAALKTTWEADEKAPAKQIGYIIYEFTLSK